MVDSFDSGARNLVDKAAEQGSSASALLADAFQMELVNHKAGHQQGARIEPLPPWNPGPICGPFDPFCRPRPDPFPWEEQPKQPKPGRRRRN